LEFLVNLFERLKEEEEKKKYCIYGLYAIFFRAAMFALLPEMTFISISALSGAVMYGFYANCDPLKSNRIEKPDQMMPYMVLEIFYDVPGMAGVFVVTVFSGTLRYK